MARTDASDQRMQVSRVDPAAGAHPGHDCQTDLMPEGDTVFQTAARLHRALAGQELVIADLRWPSLAEADLVGDTTIEVVARGKHLLQRLTSGRTLHSHLRMEGSWRTQPADPPTGWGSHDIRALLVTPGQAAIGRKLGMLDLVATRDEATLVGHLGPDVLGPDWDPPRALANVRAASGPIMIALLDQRNLAGLGTVYASESLFLQHLSPWTPVETLDDRALAGVIGRAYRLLNANRDDPRRTTTGSRVEGEQDYVHGRSGRPCRRCGTTIEVASLDPADPNARVAFFCRTCQPGPHPPVVRQAPLGSQRKGPETRRSYRTWIR